MVGHRTTAKLKQPGVAGHLYDTRHVFGLGITGRQDAPNGPSFVDGRALGLFLPLRLEPSDECGELRLPFIVLPFGDNPHGNAFFKLRFVGVT